MEKQLEKQFTRLLIRWVVNSFGIWLAAIALDSISLNSGINPIIIAGLMLALVNAILRPAVILLSLPAILLTLGLFIVVVNGLMVVLADKLYSGLTINNLWASILAGVLIGLINYIVTISLEGWGKRKSKHE
ncbi:phage holin family protein [Candidatus Saccharibacteria bacterium]|nr:phage holin family protein [Candidatus Saccharibacteria bacterium]